LKLIMETNGKFIKGLAVCSVLGEKVVANRRDQDKDYKYGAGEKAGLIVEDMINLTVSSALDICGRLIQPEIGYYFSEKKRLKSMTLNEFSIETGYKFTE